MNPHFQWLARAQTDVALKVAQAGHIVPHARSSLGKAWAMKEWLTWFDERWRLSAYRITEGCSWPVAAIGLAILLARALYFNNN